MSRTVYKLNGREVTAEEFRQGATTDWLEGAARVSKLRESNPRISESSGVMPRQVSKERKRLRKLQEQGFLTGVAIQDNSAVQYTSQGEQGRRGWMRYRKKVDYDGCYGDTYTDDGRYGD